MMRTDIWGYAEPDLFWDTDGEDYLIKDVIPFVESKFRVGGSKEKRAMAGLSMGSL